MANIQSKTLGEIRRSVGQNLGICIDGEATSTTDTTSLIDTVNLIGGDDEHNNKQVRIYDAAGSIVDGETQSVSDYAGATHDATTGAFTDAITDGDKYEMWNTPWRINEINDVINQVIMRMTSRCPQPKRDNSVFTKSTDKRYAIPSGFISLERDNLRYAESVGISHLLDNCDSAWTAGSVNVTVTADTAFKRKGAACVKAVEAGGSGAGAILAYGTISSSDISDCDKIEFDFYSSIALTAGQLQIHLDDTAAIASAIETIDIPACSAGQWYRLSLSLASPHLDTAIISIGIYQVADVGAFTFYVDDLNAVYYPSKVFRVLPSEYWKIIRGTTNYIQISSNGLSLIGDNKELEFNGYKNPSLLTADSSISEIDPGWLIERVTAEIMLNHAKSPTLDIDDLKTKADRRFAYTEASMPNIITDTHGAEVI
jgi:hypothetical protein